MDNPVKLEILPPLKRNWRRSLGYTWPCPAAIRPQRNRRIFAAMEQLQQFPLSGPPLRMPNSAQEAIVRSSRITI